jgi:hypothetical protein
VSYETMLAMVYSWNGDHDAAIAELEKIVKMPRGPNWGELRFSPMWDDLRKDTRFEAILTRAALPPIYD